MVAWLFQFLLGCATFDVIVAAVDLLRTHITIHSSRPRLAARRLNSGVRGHMKNLLLLSVLVSAPVGALAQDCGSALADELLQRNAKDQAARTALTSTPTSKDLNNAVLRIDKDNTAFMHNVLSECGWPKKSMVGPAAAKAAWRLTQHADMDPEYQVLASRQLRYAVFEKEAEPWDLAVLVDRNRRLNDLPQVYGMQFFTRPDGSVEFYDIVSPAQLDSRRKEIDLPSFFCWASSISKRNKSGSVVWPAGVPFQHSECADAP